MDREVKENYQVVIQAKDMAGQMGGLSGTTTVSITLSDVNDNPPRFTKSELSLPETCEEGEWGQAVVPAPPPIWCLYPNGSGLSLGGSVEGPLKGSE